MAQISFADAEYAGKRKKTRREVFLEEMAKVEHAFRVIKRQFGLVKVRFRGLAKNTAHVTTLFTLSNCGWRESS